MKFALDPSGAQYLIKKYTPENITVNDKDYHCSIIVGPTTLIPDWRPQKIEELKAEDFAPIIALKPAIFILGVGQKHEFPPAEILQPLYLNHIGIEVMTTAAACRTYNVLASEGRLVIAGLLRG